MPDELAMMGDVLELATGSGIWTERLPRRATSVTAVDGGSPVLTRRLNDGRTYRVVKNRFAPAELVASCAAAGLTVTVQETASVFMFGIGGRQR